MGRRSRFGGVGPGGRVKDRDFGYRQVIGNLTILGRMRPGPGVVVGVPADAGTYPDGTPVIMVAAANEFGTGRVPERSYLRSTADARRDEYAAELTRIAGRATGMGAGARRMLIRLGVRTILRRDLQRLGAQMVDDVQRTITDLRDPANAPSTVAQKGFDNPLIETERLRASIDFEVEGV